jgi:hypothetical protein
MTTGLPIKMTVSDYKLLVQPDTGILLQRQVVYKSELLVPQTKKGKEGE